MTLTLLQQHWALAAASILGTAVVLFVVWRAWLDSSRGRLRLAQRRLRSKVRESLRQQQGLQRKLDALERLESKAESVPPRRLQEAAEAAQDAEALLKIANDQVLVAENHVRKIIVEEFPPRLHDRLRARYLPGERADARPFSF